MMHLRERAGLSVVDVSTAVSVSAATVRAWESGKRFPRVDRLLAYLSAVGADLVELHHEMAGAPSQEKEFMELYESAVADSGPEGDTALEEVRLLRAAVAARGWMIDVGEYEIRLRLGRIERILGIV
jgi:transcriptional regulator with XRE-family HTH domain